MQVPGKKGGTDLEMAGVKRLPENRGAQGHDIK
jgi:hypothetical protein